MGEVVPAAQHSIEYLARGDRCRTGEKREDAASSRQRDEDGGDYHCTHIGDEDRALARADPYHRSAEIQALRRHSSATRNWRTM